MNGLINMSLKVYFFGKKITDIWGEKGKATLTVVPLIYVFSGWLFLVCVLTRDDCQPWHIGTNKSSQLSYTARLITFS